MPGFCGLEGIPYKLSKICDNAGSSEGCGGGWHSGGLDAGGCEDGMARNRAALLGVSERNGQDTDSPVPSTVWAWRRKMSLIVMMPLKVWSSFATTGS